MELQEPILKAVISEVRFDATPRFPDARATIIEQVREAEGLKTWVMNEAFLQVFTEGDPRTLLQVSNANFSASFENTERQDCRETTRRTFETALEALKLETVTFIGVRSLWLAATDDFDSLNDRLIETIGAGSPSILEPVGQKPSDSGWVFEFRTTEPEHLLRLGPMKPEQAMTQIFRDKEASNYPPEFLFLDLDRQYRTSTTGTSAVIARWSSAFDRCVEVAELIVSRLRSLI